MRTRRGLALGLLITVALAGCESKDNGGGGVATAGGTPTTSSSASTGAASQQEQAVKYTQCLRQHGLDVADPENGKVPVIQQGSESQDKIEAATTACKPLLPTVPSKKLDATELATLREVSKCIREHGFPQFPDPDSDEGGIVIDDSDGIDTKSAAFKAAQQQCGMNQPPPSSGTGGSTGGQRGNG